MILRKSAGPLYFPAGLAAVYAIGHILSMIYYPPWGNLCYPCITVRYYLSHNLMGLLYGLLMGIDRMFWNPDPGEKSGVNCRYLFDIILILTLLCVAYISFFEGIRLLPFVNPHAFDDPAVFFLTCLAGYMLPAFFRKPAESLAIKAVRELFSLILVAAFIACLIRLEQYMANFHSNRLASFEYPPFFGFSAAIGVLIGLHAFSQALFRRGQWRIDWKRMGMIGPIVLFLIVQYKTRSWNGYLQRSDFCNTENRFFLFALLGYNLTQLPAKRPETHAETD